MKRAAIICLCVAALLICGIVAFGEGTVSDSWARLGPINKITISWTAGTNGFASGDTASHVRGEILRVVCDPDDTSVPTNNYDVTLTDASGIDLLAGKGANLSSTTASSIVPGEEITDGTTTSVVPFAINEKLSLVATNTGNETAGVVILYVR